MREIKGKKQKNVYALVEVESGIPVQVELFNNFFNARTKEKIIRSKINRENDETAIFKLKL